MQKTLPILSSFDLSDSLEICDTPMIGLTYYSPLAMATEAALGEGKLHLFSLHHSFTLMLLHLERISN